MGGISGYSFLLLSLPHIHTLSPFLCGGGRALHQLPMEVFVGARQGYDALSLFLDILPLDAILYFSLFAAELDEGRHLDT